MTKDDIRKQTIEKRDNLSQEEIYEKSRRIFETLSELDELSDADSILVYASMRSEVITDDIILDCLSRGKKVYCPKVTDKNGGKMEFVRIYAIEELIEGYFGIREPEIIDTSELYDNSDPDRTVMIMPGVAFDKERDRIGYSGGFYDRYLASHEGIRTIALGFECQITSGVIPVEETDIKPDILLTEERILGA